MSDEPTTHDSTDTGPELQPERNESSTEEGRQTASLDRRGFLQATAGSLAALAALDGLTDTVSADGSSRKHLLVIGRGPGRHAYDIRMKTGSIRKATYADPGDRVSDTDGNPGADRADGELWHWNLDSFSYTGEIASVEGNGTLSVHFLDGAFHNQDVTMVRGQGQGRHDYTMGTNDGDIDIHFLYTEDGDDDRGISDSTTHDWVTGYILGRNEDGYFTDDQVQFLRIDDGHLKFDEETENDR